MAGLQLVVELTIALFLVSGRTRVGGDCNGKTVHVNESGIITDGKEKYQAQTLCEWLIKAPNKTIAIFLDLHETECGYDFVHIYDGLSYKDSLLAAFSGDVGARPTIRAFSGAMLVYLYSDASYVRSGLKARYWLEDCPFECSNHGQCENGTCSCDAAHSGIGCQVEKCSANCSYHGHCDLSLGRCVCDTGYIGESCEVNEMSSGSLSHQWYNLSTYSNVFTPRTSHAGVYTPLTDRVWVYGGYALGKVLSDILYFTFSTSQWTRVVPVGIIPTGRHFHSAVLWNDVDLVVFGGQLACGNVTNELWIFNTVSLQWHLISGGNCTQCPRGVAAHAAALVGDILFIHGGYTPHKSFTSRLWSFELVHKVWSKVSGSGMKSSSRRFVGHSMVYHEGLQALVFYGGFKPRKNDFHRSQQVLAFDVVKHFWTTLTPEKAGPVYGRAYHSATVFGNYMVVYGGSVHYHNFEEMCYSNGTHAYHLGCHVWREDLRSQPADMGSSLHFGHLGHVAVKRGSNMLVIVGGFRGTFSGEVLALRLSSAVVDLPALSNRNSTDSTHLGSHCSNLTMKDCQKDPECVWCTVSSIESFQCVYYLQRLACASPMSVMACSNICSTAHTSCASCLSTNAWWPEDTPQHCDWCVVDQKCYPSSLSSDRCRPLPLPFTSPHYYYSYSNTSLLFSAHQCQKDDVPPGLTRSCFLTRSEPPTSLDDANFEHLDSVSRAKNAKLVFSEQLTVNKENEEWTTCRAEGFIRPLLFQSVSLPPYYTMQLLASSVDQAQVHLRVTETAKDKETIRNVTLGTGMSKSTSFSSMLPVAVNNTSPHYYIAIYGTHQTYNVKHAGKVTVKWNGYRQSFNGTHLSGLLELLSGDYLEPYKSTNCHILTNCLQCVSNAGCGWCSGGNYCLRRVDGQPSCNKNLITNGEGCWLCSDYSDCFRCVSDANCSWVESGSFCVRRARGFFKSITNSSQCSLPCEKLTTCFDCNLQLNYCSWCSGIDRCIATLSLRTRGIYGQCVAVVGRYGGIKNCDYLNCHSATKCSECLSRSRCGWWYSEIDPSNGMCVSGDFGAPYLEGGANYSVDAWGIWKWQYDKCPDMLECSLGRHDCDVNAVCENTPDLYECHCKRGFMGNGKQCEKTCYEECLHGNCSGAPDYECDCELGWTGVSCNESCGCHGHSRCSMGVGICDECHHNTMGQFCHLCVPGSFGNATNEIGCLRCQCNGHGDPGKHLCDTATGQCYCLPSYNGFRCDFCEQNYYGNPVNGGHCYFKCNGLTVIPNEGSGSVGSYRGDGLASDYANCLWIITAATKMTVDRLSLRTISDVEDFLRLSQANRSEIVFTINRLDMHTVCGEDVVYVYDGLPAFVLNLNASQVNFNSKLIAAYCGEKPVTRPVKALSGVMVVWYRGSVEMVDGKQKGFNASYDISEVECGKNSSCNDSRDCECSAAMMNGGCEIAICPSDCASNNTVCHEDRAVCVWIDEYTSRDCSGDNVTLLAGVEQYSRSLALSASDCDDDNGSLSSLPGIIGATAIYSSDDCIYLFGGYLLSGDFPTSLTKIILATSSWQRIQLTSVTGKQDAGKEIQGRTFHTSVFSDPQMIVIGGWTARGPTGNVLHIDVGDNTVRQGGSLPVTLAGHTATLVREFVYVIGGLENDSSINNAVYVYDVSVKVWHSVTLSGTKPAGCYGHTATYYSDLDSIMVFGGYHNDIKDGLRQLSKSRFLYSLSVTPGQEGQWRLWRDRQVNFDFPFNWAFAIGGKMMMIGWDSRRMHSSMDNVASKIYHPACNESLPVADTRGLAVPFRLGQAVAFDSSDRHVYSIGGFDGTARGDIYSIIAPSDRCSLVSPSWTNLSCVEFPGCTFCGNESTGYETCVSSQPPCCSMNENVNFCQYPDCSVWQSCSECVSSLSSQYPISCGWCPCRGMCIRSQPLTDIDCDCTVLSQCQLLTVVHCNWNDCETCQRNSPCAWAISETGSRCVEKAAIRHDEVRVHHGQCDMSCSVYTNCLSCAGRLVHSESRMWECSWSENLQLCISPISQPLICAFGQCGRVAHNSSQCLQPCSNHAFCWRCIKQSTCGWCAEPNQSGKGLCLEGTIYGPTSNSCQLLSSTSGNHSTNASSLWSFLDCPREDECTNQHHTCRPDQECRDTKKSFECHCRDGYKEYPERYECVPSCDDLGGCDLHGSCVAPNTCQCKFGYVGNQCSTVCQCSGVGQCVDDTPEGRQECIECRNNTKGPQCSQCKPFFVHSMPITCWSCRTFCNGNSDICLDRSVHSLVQSMNISIENQNDIVAHINISQGPFWLQAVCMHCQNNSHGEKCEICDKGYFNLSTEKKKVNCTACMCNGHGTTCRQDGTGCNCQHQTESAKGCQTDCHLSQCALCVEGFSGNPRGGFPCYKDTNIGSKSRVKVNATYSKLLAVVPQYTNVDVELTLWIISGQVNVLVSTEEHDIEQHIDMHDQHSVFFSSDGESSSLPVSVSHQRVPDLSKPPVVRTLSGSRMSLSGVDRQLRIMIPHTLYHLHDTKIYIAVIGACNGSSDFLFYFRQDSAEIDLFIFFSVFFSSFFLFLGLCVVGWKIKQRLDNRWEEQAQIFEMVERAKRPFAGIDFLCERDVTGVNHRRLKRIKLRPVAPMVQQPTEENTAVVQTVLIQLPGSPFELLRLALATALVHQTRNRGKRHLYPKHSHCQPGVD